MRVARLAAMAVLAVVLLLSAFPALVTADPSDEQFRNDIDLPPSLRYPLGTDDLGRNRMARLLHGTRTSLLLAPAAAALSVVLACSIGLAAGGGGRIAVRLFESVADLTGSLPWLLMLIGLRAALPLEASPFATTAITFAMLALLGWAGPARVIRNLAANLRERDFTIQARALGQGGWRFSTKHLLPHVWPVAAAQFWINLPVFILVEANLGLLGMGIPEPYASLGNQLRDLESYQSVMNKPWLLAPAVLLTAVVSASWIISLTAEETA
ncbi:MAG: ABC transporter permease [Bryobacteraceae bacterium]|nr:ABC transporter permease [Bryobacteraceae bacterium]